ncbi:hypothetical protein FA95DRAFT_1606028, partial [Auriscalpium vulgare]
MSLEMASSLSSLELFDLTPNAETSSSSAERYIENAFSQLLAMADKYIQKNTSATSGEPATTTHPSVNQSWTLLGNDTSASTSAPLIPSAELALPPGMFLVAPPQPPSEAR